MTTTPAVLESDLPPLARGRTALRALLTLLFFLAFEVAATVLQALVIFQLAWAFITRRPPSPGVREFSNKVLAYMYETTRWVTWNRADAPFPLGDFPAQLQPVPELDRVLDEDDFAGEPEDEDEYEDVEDDDPEERA